MILGDGLRQRLMIAIAAGSVLGCQQKSEATSGSVTVPPQPPSPPQPSASASVVSVPVSASVPTSVVTEPAPPTSASAHGRPANCASHLKVEKYCFAAFKGPTSQVPNPKRSYDKSGCLPDEEVRDMCNGVRDVLSGPKIEGPQCCYSVCRGPLPPCGRALVANDASQRMAASIARRDWSRAPIAVSPVAPALALRLARAWTEDALLEHASIASFARFSLELLIVGAPPELIEDAHRAGLDEIGHARACFEIASAYRGEALGPGTLSLDGIAPRTSLAAIAAAAAAEACVGETFSAFAAIVARDRCKDPAIHSVLARIAEDETRHAELGFRFVAWALRHGDAVVHEAVDAAFAQALSEHQLQPTSSESEEWRAAGRLDEAARNAAFVEASRTVIVPTLAELRSIRG